MLQINEDLKELEIGMDNNTYVFQIVKIKFIERKVDTLEINFKDGGQFIAYNSRTIYTHMH